MFKVLPLLRTRTVLKAFRIARFLRKLWGPKLQGHLFILSNVLFVIKPRFKFRALAKKSYFENKICQFSFP